MGSYVHKIQFCAILGVVYWRTIIIISQKVASFKSIIVSFFLNGTSAKEIEKNIIDNNIFGNC